MINHNFHARTHKELYESIHERDRAVVHEIDAAWQKFRAVISTAKADLESAVHEAGAVWVGAAGERFTGANTPLVKWAEDVHEAGAATQRSFQNQHFCYTGALHQMPEPVQVTSTANDDFWGVPAGLTHLVGGQTDQDAQEQAANAAKLEAVRVMEGYQDGAFDAVHALGRFVPPPTTTTTTVYESPIPPPPPVHATTSHPPSLPGSQQPAPQAVAPQQQSEQRSLAPQGTTERSSAAPEALLPSPPTPSATTPPTPAQQPAQSLTVLPRIGSTSPAGTTLTTAAASPTSITSRLNPGLGSSVTGSGSRTLSGPSPVDGHTAPGGPHGPGGAGGAQGGSRPVVTPGAPLPASPQQATRLPASATPPPAGMTALPPNGRSNGDNQHHKSAPYLEEHRDVWGADSIPKVSPPVIGDDRQ
ncbi:MULTISPECIES: PPE domain-containing protein [Actinosynnema]|uniref:PPE domain-containing protein n=1 Tax=Actinosynnema TaxID=40566 RepID=UPI0020A535FE|nr:PPE domain-containing protein [Actinosynnema pretiosum]